MNGWTSVELFNDMVATAGPVDVAVYEVLADPISLIEVDAVLPTRHAPQVPGNEEVVDPSTSYDVAPLVPLHEIVIYLDPVNGFGAN